MTEFIVEVIGILSCQITQENSNNAQLNASFHLVAVLLQGEKMDDKAGYQEARNSLKLSFCIFHLG